MLNLALRPSPVSPAEDPVLLTLLDGLHEVVEDARVDLEIALADDERVFRGFEALLGVGGKSGVTQGREVIRDAREYVAEKQEGGTWKRLEERVREVEDDLMKIKGALHEGQGMEPERVDTEDEEGSRESKDRRSVWERLELKTIVPPASARGSARSPAGGDKRRPNLLSSVGSAGRSFSASVIGTPRRVGGFASGLYRGPPSGRGQNGKKDGKGETREEEESDGLLMDGSDDRREEDDVE